MPQIRARIAAELTSCVLLPDESPKQLSTYNGIGSKSFPDIKKEVTYDCSTDAKSTPQCLCDEQSAVCLWDNLPEALQTVLPKGYTYIVEQLDEYELRDFTGAPGQQFKLKALIRTSTTNEKEAKQWLSSMMEHSQCTYRTSRTYKPTMTRVLYKVDMHCQHKRKVLTTKQRAKMSLHVTKKCLAAGLRKKKTDCPSALTLRVQRPSNKLVRKYRTPNDLLQHPTLVNIVHDHNHPIHSTHSLSFRPIHQETKESYFQLFQAGHSASTAWHAYETRLLQNSIYSNTAQVDLADRSINP